MNNTDNHSKMRQSSSTDTAPPLKNGIKPLMKSPFVALKKKKKIKGKKISDGHNDHTCKSSSITSSSRDSEIETIPLMNQQEMSPPHFGTSTSLSLDKRVVFAENDGPKRSQSLDFHFKSVGATATATATAKVDSKRLSLESQSTLSTSPLYLSLQRSSSRSLLGCDESPPPSSLLSTSSSPSGRMAFFEEDTVRSLTNKEEEEEDVDVKLRETSKSVKISVPDKKRKMPRMPKKLPLSLKQNMRRLTRSNKNDQPLKSKPTTNTDTQYQLFLQTLRTHYHSFGGFFPTTLLIIAILSGLTQQSSILRLFPPIIIFCYMSALYTRWDRYWNENGGYSAVARCHASIRKSVQNQVRKSQKGGGLRRKGEVLTVGVGKKIVEKTYWHMMYGEPAEKICLDD